MKDQAHMGDYLGQDLEVDLIKTIAPFVRQAFFVDIGAEKGSFASLMFSLGMRGALFEPMSRHHVPLAEMAAANDSKAHPYAIDERDGARDLYVASDADGKELDFFHSLHKLGAEKRFQHSKSIPVICRSIESLVAAKVIPEAVGILKTDTEGNDLFVLRGLGGLRPELIICEYFTEGLYSGWESARPELAIDLLRPKGYTHYLATKRVGEFEYCTASPTGFLPSQWGNLFFLSDQLFAVAEMEIGKFLTEVESRLIGSMQAICADRVAKESVIQGLLAR